MLAEAVPLLDQIAAIFLSQGLLGAVCIVLAVALYRKDAALVEISKARVDDAKKFGEIVAENSKTNALLVTAVNGLVVLFQSSKLVR